MSKKSEYLRALVTERLTAAADEIFALFERTIAEYEEELSRSKEENQRKQRLLDSAQGARAEPQTPDAPTPHTCLDQGSSGLSDSSGAVRLEPELGLFGVKSECGESEGTETSEDWTLVAGPSAPPRDSKDDDQNMEPEGQTAAPDSHECCICDETFVDPQSLKRHMDLHMEEVELLSRAKGEEDTFKRRAPQSRPQTHRTLASFPGSPFSCPFCKRDFARKSDLQYHILIHTGEKPFSCSQCNRRFNRKSNLYRHYRNHAKKKIL
ncbi:zinc finger and SCAN domain-containing protein 10-like [Periophthalmus magnuspinnatus]|uniref:zinc finger and SCAN domain-containing protein 10-like n=1 Tax=Periophthalmus magnuspinnatus TaxID=409849 RepID=UPI00243637BE|nr:zinc finger and SCAN domain-containing protein 10-like [Periophthalmus magnuspinnatus]